MTLCYNQCYNLKFASLCLVIIVSCAIHYCTQIRLNCPVTLRFAIPTDEDEEKKSQKKNGKLGSSAVSAVFCLGFRVILHLGYHSYHMKTVAREPVLSIVFLTGNSSYFFPMILLAVAVLQAGVI